MSDTSSLTELARFIGQSQLAASNSDSRQRAVNDIVNHLSHRVARPRVSDLLSVVLTLSARTRRMVMPKVEIELDVFSPGGHRAVWLRLPN
jgi:hypothetical protein